MLVQFTIENYRSIKSSAVVSFAASKDNMEQMPQERAMYCTRCAR